MKEKKYFYIAMRPFFYIRATAIYYTPRPLLFVVLFVDKYPLPRICANARLISVIATSLYRLLFERLRLKAAYLKGMKYYTV